MKAPQHLGLIVEGNVTKSVILRYPGLAEHIGPIKASVFSVAQRVSKFIRAGVAVSSYESFAECEMILIRIPDAAVERVVKEIVASQLNVSGICFVLCESWLPTSVLAPLQERGALVATLLGIPAESAHWFAVEGEYAALKRTKRLLNDMDASVVELKPGSKHLYVAASAFAETLPRALFASAQKALRACGLSGNHLYAVMEEMAQSMFRDISRGARAGWTGPLMDCPEEIASDYLTRLRSTRPDMAVLLSDQLKLAEPFMMQRLRRRSKKANVPQPQV
jgi:predicted short-subunit dehydrogenase-like oxidoreductase (DUF2520 family)